MATQESAKRSVRLAGVSGEPVRVWVCKVCGRLHTPAYAPTRDSERDGGAVWPEDRRDAWAAGQAEECCGEAACEICGVGLGYLVSAGRVTRCDSCAKRSKAEADRRQLEAAVAMTPEQFRGSPYADNMLYDKVRDRWHRNAEEADHWLDDYPEASPLSLWCSEETGYAPNIEDMVRSHIDDNMDEDAADRVSDEAWEELRKFEEKWWKDNNPRSYEAVFTHRLVLENKPKEATAS